MALIPATLDGTPLTLQKFKETLDVKNGPKFHWYKPGDFAPEQAAASSYWALVSKDCIRPSKTPRLTRIKNAGDILQALDRAQSTLYLDDS